MQTPAEETSTRRWLRWLGVWVAGVLAMVLLTIMWAWNSQVGTQYALQLAIRLSNDLLTVGRVDGTLAGPLTLQQFHWGNSQSPVAISADTVEIDIAYAALLHRTLRIELARARNLHIELRPSSNQSGDMHPTAFTLYTPIGLDLPVLELNDAKVDRAGESLLVIRRLTASAQWHDSTVELSRLDVSSPQGALRFAGQVTEHHAHRYEGRAHGEFTWRVSDRSYAGQLNARAAGDDASLDLKLTAPMTSHLQISVVQNQELPWHGTLDVPQFDPRESLVPNTSSLQLAQLHVEGEGTLQHGAINGRLRLNDTMLHLEQLKLTKSDRTIRLETLDARLDPEGSLHAAGHFTLADVPAGEIKASWRKLSLSPEWLGQPLQTAGDIALGGSAQAFSGNVQAQFGARKKPAAVAAKFNGSSSTLQVESLRIQQSAGVLEGAGTLRAKPRLEWDARLHAAHFDPSEFAAAWRGDLTFAVQTRGSVQQDGLQASLDLDRLSGQLRGRHLSGAGHLKLMPEVRLSGSLSLQAGESAVTVRARQGTEPNADVNADIRALSDWLPSAQGRLRAELHALGQWPDITVRGDVQANDLRIATLAARRVHVQGRINNPKTPSGEIAVALNDAAVAGYSFPSVAAQLSGDLQQHSFTVNAMGTPVGGQLTATGGYINKEWRGSLEDLTMTFADRKFSLDGVTSITASSARIDVEQSCLRSEEVLLCAGFKRDADRFMQMSYRLQRIPLALFTAVAPKLPLSLQGEIEGDGNVTQTASDSWSGTAQITSSAGKISRKNETAPGPLLTYKDLELRANLDGTRARMTARARFNESGVLTGDINVAELDQPAPDLDGRVQAALPDISPLSVFTPQLANVAGAIRANAVIAGNTREPKISGELHATQLAAQVPALGLKLSNGDVQASADQSGAASLSAKVTSGQGTLQMSGEVAADQVNVHASGDRFLIADIPSAHVVIAPDLKLHYADSALHVSGTTAVTKADVDVQKLPRGAKPARASRDIVVVDEPQSQEPTLLPVFATVTVSLGDDVKVSGYGLNAAVKGQLTVREEPGSETRAAGQLNVTGTYRAYGQDLTIENGKVLYAGVPIDNPGLDIKATRKVEDVTAGVRIAGTAHNPQLSVYSDPEMGEANALSYLVAGRPLDAIGTGESDGSALQSAARSLGTAGGGLLAKKLGARLGIDQVGVEKNELTGGSVFTVGQYLSPRLFLSYGVGLFEAGDIVTLRYRLSKNLLIQAQRGSDETRTGLEYRTER